MKAYPSDRGHFLAPGGAPGGPGFLMRGFLNGGSGPPPQNIGRGGAGVDVLAVTLQSDATRENMYDLQHTVHDIDVHVQHDVHVHVHVHVHVIAN